MDALENKAPVANGAVQEDGQMLSSKEHPEEKERIARVNAAWEQMNSGLPAKVPTTLRQTVKKPADKGTPKWMVALGMLPKKTLDNRNREIAQKRPAESRNGTSEEAKKLAAAALSAVRDATSVVPAGNGKIAISEIRDFAGKEIEIKKFVNPDSKEATEKAKLSIAPPSALDNILEQIKKKQKLSVLDKTKKDWGEFKEENKGLDVELDAYKKSSNQYLDKVSFLQRTDLREFERERDARLASQSKRRVDTREDDN